MLRARPTKTDLIRSRLIWLDFSVTSQGRRTHTNNIWAHLAGGSRASCGSNWAQISLWNGRLYDTNLMRAPGSRDICQAPVGSGGRVRKRANQVCGWIFVSSACTRRCLSNEASGSRGGPELEARPLLARVRVLATSSRTPFATRAMPSDANGARRPQVHQLSGLARAGPGPKELAMAGA